MNWTYDKAMGVARFFILSLAVIFLSAAIYKTLLQPPAALTPPGVFCFDQSNILVRERIYNTCTARGTQLLRCKNEAIKLSQTKVCFRLQPQARPTSSPQRRNRNLIAMAGGAS